MAKLTKKTEKELAKTALEMRKMAYTPFSGHAVGAALLAKDGRVFTGCNVENSSYSPTICAERTAFVKAVSEGAREFTAIAIAGGFGEVPETYCAPCGVCRQVMVEFCRKDFKVILAKTPQDYKVYTLEEIMPLGFKIEDVASGTYAERK
ncbi:MAG: cytidine deaminase [Firmicutes bacterium]|nr:cytidine deaminase [Bacillota bacterium]